MVGFAVFQRSISIFVDNVRLPGPEDFEFWNAVSRNRHGTSDAVSSAWQARAVLSARCYK